MKPENRLDLVKSYASQYKATNRKGKSFLLDSFCALTGYNRKYAIGLLRAGAKKPKRKNVSLALLLENMARRQRNISC